MFMLIAITIIEVLHLEQVMFFFMVNTDSSKKEYYYDGLQQPYFLSHAFLTT